MFLINNQAPEKILNLISKYNEEIVKIPDCISLQKPVQGHTDMLFFKKNKDILMDESYYNLNKEFFDKIFFDYKIRLSKTKIADNYPKDVIYDVICMDGKIYGYNFAEELKEYGSLIKVKQGYTKCSSVVFKNFNNEYSIITADLSIYNILKNEYNVLLINNPEIILNGYNCGFIGGASAVIEEYKEIVFFGDPTLLSDWNLIKEFINKNGYKEIYIKKEPLTDYGSLLKI